MGSFSVESIEAEENVSTRTNTLVKTVTFFMATMQILTRMSPNFVCDFFLFRYEKQRDTLYNQSFNVDQTRFAIQNVKDTVTTVAAMKSASKELKVAMKDIKIDDIEDLHDG